MRLVALTRRRWLLGTLLIAASALFAIGVASERDNHHDAVATVESGEHDEAAEQAKPNESSESHGETIFGINIESTPLVAFAVIISVGLAAATWRADHKLILLVAAFFSAVFAVLDVTEFRHQVKESATTIAAIAGVIAVIHVVAALLAEQRRAAAP